MSYAGAIDLMPPPTHYLGKDFEVLCCDKNTIMRYSISQNPGSVTCEDCKDHPDFAIFILAQTEL